MEGMELGITMGSEALMRMPRPSTFSSNAEIWNE